MKVILMAATLNRLSQESIQEMLLLGEVKKTQDDEPYLVMNEEQEQEGEVAIKK